MSTPPPAAAADQPAKAGGLKQHLPFVVALVAGLVVGGASGAFVVGPAMATGIAPAGAAPTRHAARAQGDGDASDDAHAAEGEEGEDGGEDHGAKEGEKAGEKPAHTIDNLVLNPAESGGTRFLLLTVTFELKDAAVLEQMKARDAELRDAVLVTLGKRTVDQLADMTQREPLKAELTAAAAKLFKKGAVRRIYFPQFVIQ